MLETKQATLALKLTGSSKVVMCIMCYLRLSFCRNEHPFFSTTTTTTTTFVTVKFHYYYRLFSKSYLCFHRNTTLRILIRPKSQSSNCPKIGSMWSDWWLHSIWGMWVSFLCHCSSLFIQHPCNPYYSNNATLLNLLLWPHNSHCRCSRGYSFIRGFNELFAMHNINILSVRM